MRGNSTITNPEIRDCQIPNPGIPGSRRDWRGIVKTTKISKWVTVSGSLGPYIRGSFHKLVTKRHNSVNFQNIKKIRNIGFVCNLILNNSCEFYYDDVTVTSFVNDKYGDATAESIP